MPQSSFDPYVWAPIIQGLAQGLGQAQQQRTQQQLLEAQLNPPMDPMDELVELRQFLPWFIQATPMTGDDIFNWRGPLPAGEAAERWSGGVGSDVERIYPQGTIGMFPHTPGPGIGDVKVPRRMVQGLIEVFSDIYGQYVAPQEVPRRYSFEQMWGEWQPPAGVPIPQQPMTYDDWLQWAQVAGWTQPPERMVRVMTDAGPVEMSIDQAIRAGHLAPLQDVDPWVQVTDHLGQTHYMRLSDAVAQGFIRPAEEPERMVTVPTSQGLVDMPLQQAISHGFITPPESTITVQTAQGPVDMSVEQAIRAGHLGPVPDQPTMVVVNTEQGPQEMTLDQAIDGGFITPEQRRITFRTNQGPQELTVEEAIRAGLLTTEEEAKLTRARAALVGEEGIALSIANQYAQDFHSAELGRLHLDSAYLMEQLNALNMENQLLDREIRYGEPTRRALAESQLRQNQMQEQLLQQQLINNEIKMQTLTGLTPDQEDFALRYYQVEANQLREMGYIVPPFSMFVDYLQKQSSGEEARSWLEVVQEFDSMLPDEVTLATTGIPEQAGPIWQMANEFAGALLGPEGEEASIADLTMRVMAEVRNSYDSYIRARQAQWPFGLPPPDEPPLPSPEEYARAFFRGEEAFPFPEASPMFRVSPTQRGLIITAVQDAGGPTVYRQILERMTARQRRDLEEATGVAFDTLMLIVRHMELEQQQRYGVM